MIESTEQAIDLLQDISYSENDREHAILFLRDNQTKEGIDALVASLEDDDYGVRWAASNALAAFGEAAMPVLLGALMKEDSDSRLRESSVHIIHSNSSQKVKSDSEELLKALKGPSANISSMEAAFELMEKWHIR